MDHNNITCSICEVICQSEDDFRTHLTQYHNASELKALVDQSERRTAHLQQYQVEQEAYKILKKEKKSAGGDKIKVATRLDSTGTKIDSVTVTRVAETSKQKPSKSTQKDEKNRPSEVQSAALDKIVPGFTELTYRWFMGQWQLEPRCAFSKNVLLNEEGTDNSTALWLFLQGKGIENTSNATVISILKHKNLNSVCQVIAGLFFLNFCDSKEKNQLREIKEEMNENNVGSFFVEIFSLYEAARLTCNNDGISFWVVSSITNKLMSALKTRKNTSKTTVAAIPHYHTICFKYVSSLFEKHAFPVSCFMYVLDSSRTLQNGTISVKICTKYDDIVANIHKAVLDCNGLVDPDLLKEWNLSDISIVEIESLLDLLYSIVTNKEIVLSKGVIVALNRLRATTVLNRLMQNDTTCNSKETAEFLESHFVKELDIDALAQIVSSNVSADAQFDLISNLSKDNLSLFFLSPNLSLIPRDKWSLLIRWICKEHEIECTDPWEANAEGKSIDNLYTSLYDVLQLNNLEVGDIEKLIHHNFVSFEYGTSDFY